MSYNVTALLSGHCYVGLEVDCVMLKGLHLTLTVLHRDIFLESTRSSALDSFGV